MVDDPAVSFIGLEYFVNQGDDLWRLPDDELVALGTREAETIGLFEARDVGSGTVVRMPRAYPVYDGDYERHVETLRGWIDAFDNLFTVGRNGQHRYNNQDHSMLTGLLAARNVAGARFDVWGVNEEQSFHEEVRDDGVSVRDRLTPQPVADDIEAFVREAFPVYDEVALGGAFAVTAMVVLGLATLLMLSERAAAFVPMLSLLGNFLFGYAVSWPGLALGMVEAGVWGFALGWAIARLVNVLTTWTLKGLERRLAALSTLEAIDGGTIELR